jgi:hypothetical protein
VLYHSTLTHLCGCLDSTSSIAVYSVVYSRGLIGHTEFTNNSGCPPRLETVAILLLRQDSWTKSIVRGGDEVMDAVRRVGFLGAFYGGAFCKRSEGPAEAGFDSGVA